MSNSFQKIKIVKLFASNDYKTRNRAYKVITKLLKFEFGSGPRELNENDIIAIWKGLYVWLWMQDKPILHEEVVGKICKLLTEIPSEKIAMEFICSFFVTMMREWKKIDVHRLDKFYMLTRDFFNSCLSYLKTKESTELFLTFLSTKVINGSIDQGIEFKLHLLDVLIDEVSKVDCSEELTTGIVLACIQSIKLIGMKNIYVIKMKKRVIERLFSLYEESKIKMNTNRIGNILSEVVKNEKLLPTTMKMMAHLSRRFLSCTKKDNTTEVIDAASTEDTEMADEKSNVAVVEGVATEESTSTDIEETPVSQMEVDLDESEASSDESDETEPPIVVAKTMPAKIATKVTKRDKLVPVKVPEKKKTPTSPKETKVTFGKKYTKKFKKGEVSIRTSQGTIIQTEMKSILKKK